jgi:hypothetical protein
VNEPFAVVKNLGNILLSILDVFTEEKIGSALFGFGCICRRTGPDLALVNDIYGLTIKIAFVLSSQNYMPPQPELLLTSECLYLIIDAVVLMTEPSDFPITPRECFWPSERTIRRSAFSGIRFGLQTPVFTLKNAQNLYFFHFVRICPHFSGSSGPVTLPAGVI